MGYIIPRFMRYNIHRNKTEVEDEQNHFFFTILSDNFLKKCFLNQISSYAYLELHNRFCLHQFHQNPT
ncbi:hypothetical protein L1987_00408 [Smallanthus sonchifolius]|uniref:Uncharacterized protein n=1 Tax=Smallanthus sonchifolius TaxID=185202 RepID=A0ACB9K2A1_9ASTR|nr:hypothetical protein L1987_00408 [Smallanthus sonchifolius]